MDNLTNIAKVEGSSARLLTEKELNDLMRSIWDEPYAVPYPRLTMRYNLSDEVFDAMFSEVKSVPDDDVGGAINAICGIPIQKVGWMPENEVWLIDQYGQIIQRFIIK